jgi:hypothetical protein
MAAPQRYYQMLVELLHIANDQGMVVDVSRENWVIIPKNTPNRLSIENFPIVSDNTQSYIEVMKILGPEYKVYSDLFLARYGWIMPSYSVQERMERGMLRNSYTIRGAPRW